MQRAKGGRIRRASGGDVNDDRQGAANALSLSMQREKDTESAARSGGYTSQGRAQAAAARQAVDIAQDRSLRANVPGTAEKFTKYPVDQPEGYPSPRRGGGRLSAKQRQSLPSSDFAMPGKGRGPKGAGPGSYPIPDKSHARNALSRVAQHGSAAEKSRVRAKVKSKYPDIGRG